ncbi:MAG: hypothetical protein HKL80_08170 [Acidimicrobiales bacterium]|nr:hypothetical protein [Acidimicrobiales bacterium]
MIPGFSNSTPLWTESGNLPAVSWVVPSATVSDHSPARVSAGQSYVMSLINVVAQSHDGGGFHNHVAPMR